MAKKKVTKKKATKKKKPSRKGKVVKREPEQLDLIPQSHDEDFEDLNDSTNIGSPWPK